MGWRRWGGEGWVGHGLLARLCHAPPPPPCTPKNSNPNSGPPTPHLALDVLHGHRAVDRAQRNVGGDAHGEVALDDGDARFDDDGFAGHQAALAQRFEQGFEPGAQDVPLVPGAGRWEVGGG